MRTEMVKGTQEYPDRALLVFAILSYPEIAGADFGENSVGPEAYSPAGKY